MRKWIPAVALPAVATAGLLMTSHPKPADAQEARVATVAPAVAVVNNTETAFLSGGVDIEFAKGQEAVRPVSVSFPGRQVLSADVMLKGFDVQFVGSEHPVHQQKVKLENVQISGETVKFDARLVIRDNSGDIDDKYAGHIDYVVIARTR